MGDRKLKGRVVKIDVLKLDSSAYFDQNLSFESILWFITIETKVLCLWFALCSGFLQFSGTGDCEHVCYLSDSGSQIYKHRHQV